MPKISVIVPVFNTGKYIKKCLNSILSQKNVDYEIIVVNDGSTDNSDEIIKNYVNQHQEKVKYYTKQNGGLSDARNYGITKASGDYLCFVDSDDYIDENLFANLEKYIEQNIDVIKYKCIKVDDKYGELERIDGPIFECKNGMAAFNELYAADVLLEPAWLYLFKREYFQKNNFQFPVGKYHEDWAIIPFAVLSAKTMVSTGLYGYYYVQSSNSITRDNDDEKVYKRAWDMLEHYDNLIGKIMSINTDEIAVENFKIYMSNCLILKLTELSAKYHKAYINELKKRKITNNFKASNLKQFVKKAILKISIKLYLKMR